MNKILSLILITGFIFIISCGSQNIRPDLPMEERMDLALKMFEKGDYYNAKTQFRVITLSHSGSTIADKAQFYLAECHYYMKEYILSASEYERLIRVYPNSEYMDDSKYKVGMSYFKLSPKYSLDQVYTLRAVQHFQEFLEDYHTSSLVPEVTQKLQEARDKLARKVYASAEQYRKMGISTSAIIYYNMVLEKYYDSVYAANSQYGIAECNRKLHNYSESVEAFNTFIEKYPQHKLVKNAKEKVEKLQKKIEEDTNQLSNSDSP